MADLPDLMHERVSSLLTTKRLGRSLSIEASTISTNDDARRAASAGCADGHVALADTQTSGRGSRGRTWLSPAGSDLYFSIVVRLTLPPQRIPPLTLVVGLAAAEAIDAVLAEDARALAPQAEVKWPNDVWLEGEKLVGILVESSSVGEQLEPLVIGVGINVNRRDFPPDLQVPASSLALRAGGDVERAKVLAAFLNRLEPRLEAFEREGPTAAIDALNQRLALRGQPATCGEVTGVVAHVVSSGALLLRTKSGLVECVSGTLRPCGPTDQTPA